MVNNVINSYFRPMASKIDRCLHAIVLTSGDPEGLKDFACYEAIIRVPNDCTDEQRKELAEWVAMAGTKLNYQKAVCYFNDLKEKNYRR